MKNKLKQDLQSVIETFKLNYYNNKVFRRKQELCVFYFIFPFIFGISQTSQTITPNMNSSKQGGRMKIYHDLMNQSKLISVQSPQQLKDLHLSGRGADPSMRSPALSKQTQHGSQPPARFGTLQPRPQIHINTNLKASQPGGRDGLQIQGTVSKERPGGAGGQIRIQENADLLVTPEGETDSKDSARWTRRHRSLHAAAGRAAGSTDVADQPSKQSTGTLNRINRNMEQLANMKLVGGSTRLGQLIELMHKRGQKQQRIQNIESSRIENESQAGHQTERQRHTRLGGSVTDSARPRATQNLNLSNLQDQIDRIKQKSNIHVVINVGNEGNSWQGEEREPGNPIDAATQSETVAGATALKTGDRQGKQLQRLRNVDSVQLLGRDHDAHSVHGFDDVHLYQGGDAKPPSMMTMSKGNKQALEDYAKKYHHKMAGKQLPSPAASSGLQQMPHTTKHLKGTKMKIGFASGTTAPGDGDVVSNDKLNTDHSTVNSNNILLKQGIGYSSLDKSLVRLPQISGSGQTASPLTSNMGHVFAMRSGSKRTTDSLSADSHDNLKEGQREDDQDGQEGALDAGDGKQHAEDRHLIIQEQNDANIGSTAAKKRERSYRKAMSYQNYELARNSKVQDSARTLDAGETVPKGVVEIVNKLQRDQMLLYGDSSEEQQQLNFDRYSQFKVKKHRFGKDSGQNKINPTRGMPPQAQAQNNATTAMPQKLLHSKEKELKNIKSIKSVLIKGNKGTSENSNQVSTRMLTVNPSSHVPDYNSPSTTSARQQAITPFQSKGSVASPAAISYNMLSNDKERTNQLLEVFNRKLRNLGYQKEKYSNIIKQASMQLSDNQTPLGQAGIEGEVQSFQAMLAAQELMSKPGGHARVRKHASSRSPLSSGRDVLQSLSESAHRIAEAHQKATLEAMKNREEARSKISNIVKHRNAIKMVGQVERKVKETKGAFAADLSIDEQKIKVGPLAGREGSRDSARGDKQKSQKSKKFADNYNFDQYDDKTVDSDLAEQEAFSAIDVEEYQKAQQRLTAQEAQRLRLPLIDQKKKQSMQEDRFGFEQKEQSPQRGQSLRNDTEGSAQYSQEVLKTIVERRDQVEERVKDKKKFRDDLEHIAQDGHLLRDVISLDTGMSTKGAQLQSHRVTSTLTRQQANKLHKDDFEYKINQMNERMQPEFEDTLKKVTLSSKVLGPFPTAQGIIEDIKNKKEQKTQKLIRRHQRRQTLPGKESNSQATDNIAEQEYGEIKEDIEYSDEEAPSHLSEPNNDKEPANIPVTPKNNDLAVASPEKPPQMMSEYKKRQLRKAEAQKLKSAERRQEALRSKTDATHWLRASAVPEEESSIEDDRSTPETYEQMKKRERMKEFHEIRRMSRSRRRERIRQKNMHYTEEDPAAEANAEKWHKFLNKINREEEYPSNIIQKLVVKNMLEMEAKTDEEASAQDISRQFAQDDIINGLCLLHCLKNNQINQDVFNEEHTDQAIENSKNIMKAATLVKEFQAGVKRDEEHEDPQLKLGRFLARRSSSGGKGPHQANVHTGNSSKRSGLTRSPVSPDVAKRDPGSPNLQEGDEAVDSKRQIFNTQIFNKVMQQIVGFQFKEPAYHRQAAQQIKQVQDSDKSTEKDESKGGNMVLKELKSKEQEVMGKILETEEVKALAELKEELQNIKEKIAQEQARLKNKAAASMVDQTNMNKSEPSMQMFARGVNLQNQFYQVCKYAENPKITEQMGQNPVMLYFKNCQKEGSVSLPIPVLRRIHNMTLTLINYSLTNGVCSALGNAMQGNPQLLHSVHLDSNGCKDEDFIDLLRGLQNLDHVKSIIYKRNDILKTQTIENIIPLLARRKPRHLEELRIINCKIGGAVTHHLIDALLKQSSLKKLSLVKANLTLSSFNQLVKYIGESRTLQHLDLSCNSMRQEQMFPLIDVLSKDRKLLSVDLSWNTILDTEASCLKSTMDSSYLPMTKKQKQAAERTVGQFSGLSQKVIFPEKREEERQKEIELLGDETYSLITGTNLQTTTSGAFGTELVEGAGMDGEDGLADDLDGEDGAGDQEDGEVEEQADGQDQDEGTAEGDGASSPAPGTKKEEKKIDKYAEPKKLSDAAKQVKKRKLLLQRMLKALRKNLVSFIKYNQALQHFNLNNTGLTEEAIRQIGISLNKARGLVSIHLSGNPGITDRNKQFLRKRIKCKTIEPAFKIEFDITKFEKKGTASKVSPRDIHERNAQLDTLGKKQLVEENLKLQLIKKNAQINDTSVKYEQGDGHRLDFIRVVGHQCDMPGSQQWALYDDHQDTMQSCWVCDQSIHSLIFWTQSIGDRHSVLNKTRDQAHKEAITRQLVQKYDKLNPINVVDSTDRVEQRLARLYTFLKEDVDRPLICCEYTNWKPVRMLRIDEYCASLESTGARQGIDIFDRLISMGAISAAHKESKRFDDLNEEEKEEFLEYRNRTMNQYQQNWHDTLAEEIRYKKPFMANGEFLADTGHPDEEQLYVFPCFLKAGRQHYIIVKEEDLACNTVEAVDMPRDTDNYYLHKCIVESRPEDVALWSKPLRGGEKARVFKHATSVFSQWKPDNKASLAKCLEHDFALWKLPRFCKDPDEQARVMDKIHEYFPQIKEVYHYLIAKSNYPNVLYQDFFDWAKQVKIYDGGVIDEKRVTLSFEAANYVVEAQPGVVNPENALCRFEFLEILVRLAKDKYITFDKKTDKLSEAVEMIIKQCLIEHDTSDPWTGFRTNDLWTLPVNDLLEPNKAALNNLYESYFQPRKKYMDLQDCQDLFYKRTGVLKQDKHVEYCFAMSHMTIAQECREAQKYDQLSFAEFLELCGRVAQYRFKDDPSIGQLDLVQKLEFVLDEILAVQEVKRLDPVVVHQDLSESDEDY